MDEEDRITLAGEASVAASVETADAIAEAVELNEDPQVAEALDHAALAADTSVARVGWLHRSLSRLLGSLRRRDDKASKTG